MNCAEKLLEPTIFFNLYTNTQNYGLHAFFRKISIYGSDMGFHALTLTRSLGPSGDVNFEGGSLVDLEGTLDQSIVHG